MLPGISMGSVSLAGGWSGHLLIADCEDVENCHRHLLKKGSNTQKSHKDGTLSFPCADGTVKMFDLPRPHRDGKHHEGILVPDEEEQEVDTSFEEKREIVFGA